MQRGHQFPLVEFPYPVSTVSQVLNDRDRAKRFSRLRAMVAGQWLSGFIDGKLSDDVTIIMTDERWISQNLPATNITSSPSGGYTVQVSVPGPPTCTQNCTMAPGGAYNVNVGDLMMFSSSAGYALGMVTQVD